MKRLISPAAIFLAILATALGLVGCGGGHKAPYKTLPRPALPAGVPVPSCPTGNNHAMGQCLPKRSGPLSPSLQLQRLPSGITCIDLSNNDPVYGVAAWRAIRVHGVRCAVFKVNESTGFVDRTAAPMAGAAKAAGVIVGGYDFQHVCGASATSEAHVFAVYLRADGLLGPNTVPPAADAEYGGSGCNARAWELSWRAVVRREAGRDAQTYTGDWWWSPHMGRFDPGGFKWVSGYGVAWPFIPAGWHLDQWQWTSSGWNGASRSDVSLFLDGEASFRSFVGAAQPKPPQPTPARRCFGVHPAGTAHCRQVRAQVAGWQRAVTSSQAAYAARHCEVFAGRVQFFGALVRTQPRSRKLPARRRALAASQRVYARRSCGTFRGRVAYYSNRIRQAEAAN